MLTEAVNRIVKRDVIQGVTLSIYNKPTGDGVCHFKQLRRMVSNELLGFYTNS